MEVLAVLAAERLAVALSGMTVRKQKPTRAAHRVKVMEKARSRSVYLPLIDIALVVLVVLLSMVAVWT